MNTFIKIEACLDLLDFGLTQFHAGSLSATDYEAVFTFVTEYCTALIDSHSFTKL